MFFVSLLYKIRAYGQRKKLWIPEQQNIFRILLKLSQVAVYVEGVLGREAPQNTFHITYNFAKFQKNLENILCSGIKPIFAVQIL